jgi:hypothetical protein
MRLDAVSARLRPRNRWEAMDLGFAMVRHWALPVYGAWFAVVLPLALVLQLACWQLPWLAFALLWWLKPLLDRVPLHVLSRALFGATPSLAETLRALPGIWSRQAVAALTWRRLDPARSLHLPVLQLEGLQGRARRERQAVLSDPGGGGGWLTITCIHFDFALQLALIGLFGLAFPEFVQLDWQAWLAEREQSHWEQIAYNLGALLTLSIIEPFYVAAGFALYLNRRTWLEAWDLEIGFRRLVQRLQGKESALAASLLLALFLGTLAPPPALADSAVGHWCSELRERQERLQKAQSTVQQTLAEVLNEAEFPRCRLTEGWRLRDSSDERAPFGFGDGAGLPGLAEFIEGLLWVAVAAFAALLGWWLYQRWSGDRPRARPKEPLPAAPLVIHGEAIKPETLPRDAAAEAWRLWRAGAQREALSLLYRATLAKLLGQHGVDFGTSQTEDECLRQAEAQLERSELVDFLRRLTRIWQLAAYGHRPPDDGQVQALCQQWAQHFLGSTADGA